MVARVFCTDALMLMQVESTSTAKDCNAGVPGVSSRLPYWVGPTLPTCPIWRCHSASLCIALSHLAQLVEMARIAYKGQRVQRASNNNI